MTRLLRTILGLLALGVVTCAGCGPGAEDAVPNPALGPPPVIKPERGGSGPTPAPSAKAPKPPPRK
jgi:hypothetical protein